MRHDDGKGWNGAVEERRSGMGEVAGGRASTKANEWDQ